ncbi:acetyltransferase [Sphingomonas psychrotolerans]|uniref:Acetyltransferase n=1 Tax=Sphingomonas psychrotolerans TaxID=1327635 RepID=A0A2K8MFE0_9SPHN|nr:acetyltransferase [Sphingomonas psychrotolerans]ATY32597.1 acetyltransferase [Sphingomonas psychrotolerans]
MRIREGRPDDVARALEIWRAAVDATHGFLTPADRAVIDIMVAQEFLPNVALWLAVDATDRALGFLVMDGAMIDALFVDPAVHGQGIGTALLDHALSLAPDAVVDASEQASNALPFYEARGFVRTGRSETDPQGRPYPLVHLRYAGRIRVSPLA